MRARQGYGRLVTDLPIAPLRLFGILRYFGYRCLSGRLATDEGKDGSPLLGHHFSIPRL